MSNNPYEPPSEASGSYGDPKWTILPPGILLFVLAAATVLFEIPVGYTVVIDTIRSIEHYGAAEGLLTAAPFTLGFAFVFVMHVLVLLGSWRMCRRTHYRAAKAAGIISLIPVLSPGYVLGIPLGIWALIALTRPGVRESFESRVS